MLNTLVRLLMRQSSVEALQSQQEQADLPSFPTFSDECKGSISTPSLLRWNHLNPIFPQYLSPGSSWSVFITLMCKGSVVLFSKGNAALSNHLFQNLLSIIEIFLISFVTYPSYITSLFTVAYCFIQQINTILNI